MRVNANQQPSKDYYEIPLSLRERVRVRVRVNANQQQITDYHEIPLSLRERVRVG